MVKLNCWCFKVCIILIGFRLLYIVSCGGYVDDICYYCISLSTHNIKAVCSQVHKINNII